VTTGHATERLEGATKALRIERRLRARLFAPPPKLTVSEWADLYRQLTGESSAEAGQWRTDRAPFQREIMDAVSDPTVERVVFVAPSQIGKSEMLMNVMGFYIDQDPSPMLMVRPGLDDARDFSEDRIKPMIAASPRLRSRMRRGDGRRNAGDKMLRKSFDGGHLTLVGANSATGLSSRPIRIVLFDEIDKYPPSAGDKGDPIALAVNRTKNFWNRKLVLVSTPGVKGVSRIDKEWQESDQRRCYLPCPHCALLQHLQWKQLVFDDAAYACEGCGALIPETEKPRMLAGWVWRAERPEGRFPGFHLNSLYSPWTTWAELIVKFLAARKSRDTLQVFVNEEFAEVWDPMDGEGIDTTALSERREKYAAEVPAAVGVLTAAVDVQKDRLELVVKGWGAGQESWLIEHRRFYGDPGRNEVWEQLDVWRTKRYAHEAGGALTIRALCIDSGDQTQTVYGYVRPRQRKGVFATKGYSVRGKPIISRPNKANKYGVRVIPIGTDTAKDIVFARLKNETPGHPGYMHFPTVQAEGADDEYLNQFGREKVFLRYVKGVPIREYRVVPAGARNEAIDLEVLSLAALHLLGASVYDKLALWVTRAQAAGAAAPARPPGDRPAAATTLTAAPPPLSRRRPPRPGGWTNKWRQ